MGVEVNYIALLLAAVAQMVIGFAWYGPLFGKMWQKLKGFDSKSKEEMAEMQKKMMPYYAVTYVVSLITAYVLAHVMFLSQNFFNYEPLTTGLMTAFWMWLGFILPIHLGNTIFSEKKDWKLFGLDAAYWLVSLLAMGLVLGFWK
ncbi:MAG: hypothetical protein A2798_03180 [Candidatus Levybacteria bacterium RIFCSPHIGHO2_01_FULL_37_17]|nr:MAG: hypothetical protein A2798_03180 [Candidatus Levybacteria bacterium RIFCSPHIGHO2_01_FULL_37_17]OGH36858.1 MAG: hypothetical protein A2959_01170 [Candidatus Levybacteria bacterium RIFCSPLOWO2_01_FULL_38_23]